MRRLPSLHALRAFEAAARNMSFTRAAAELHVTPGAISQQVRGLEEELGQPLFIHHFSLSLGDTLPIKVKKSQSRNYGIWFETGWLI